MSRSYDGPRSLGDSLRQLAARYRKVDILAIDEVRRRWPEVVGDTLAARCAPEQVREGVLTVRVPSGAFAQRLSMEEQAIIDALADMGPRAPTSVRVVVGEVRENPL